MLEVEMFYSMTTGGSSGGDKDAEDENFEGKQSGKK
eukprot:COSAG02_NODE_4887_length_4863_cov_3.936818_2_plen_36_part_00